MDTAFADQVLRWHTFAGTAAAAAATLVGLLFVSMSLRSQLATGDYALERAVWSLGTSALVCFLDVLLVGLVVLIPAQNPIGLGGPLLALAALSIAATLLGARATRAVPGLARRHRWSTGPSLVCYGIQGGLAVALATGGAEWLPCLAVLAGALLLNASFMAWEVLRHTSLDWVSRTRRQADQEDVASIDQETGH